MTQNDNPAGRLYHILKEAKEKPGGNSTGQVWAEVLNADTGDKYEILKRVSSLQTLVKETELLIESRSDLNTNLYLRSFPRIRSVTSGENLAASWSNYQNNITDETLTRLEFCSEVLSHTSAEETITEEELETIKKEVEELRSSIHESNINFELKVIILDQVEAIRRSIEEYKIRGIKSLKNALEANIGSIIVHQDLYKKSEEKELIEKLGELIDKIDTVTSKILKVKKVISTVGKLIGLPSPD
mgnify:CR=1 FL=1